MLFETLKKEWEAKGGYNCDTQWKYGALLQQCAVFLVFEKSWEIARQQDAVEKKKRCQNGLPRRSDRSSTRQSDCADDVHNGISSGSLDMIFLKGDHHMDDASDQNESDGECEDSHADTSSQHNESWYLYAE